VNCETDFVARGEDFRTLAHEIALQIAASSPQYLQEDDIPADVLEHEAEIARNRAKEEGKPEAVMDKIVNGRLEKFKDEVVLMRQSYIRDEDLTIADLVLQAVGKTGENIVVSRFQRWELGENIGE
jgi:elongation factor Ts